MGSDELTGKIKRLAVETGYAACGIAGAEPFAEFGQALDRLVEMFPETAEEYNGMRGRVDPRRTAPWVNSLVVCVRRYGKYELPESALGLIGRTYLADRRYAGCPDNLIPKKMKQGLKDLGLRVKPGGVPERWAAVRAGVARFGRNCFVYSEHGSWINIETFRVDAELQCDDSDMSSPCPEGCTACIDACPTGALSAPNTMRMDQCAAYLTYSSPEPVDPGLWRRMGCWIYGCDRCQEVCPLNKEKWSTEETAPWMDEVKHLLTPEALAAMDEQTYHELIHPRFWYIPPDQLDRWHRNAKRALEHGKKEFLTESTEDAEITGELNR